MFRLVKAQSSLISKVVGGRSWSHSIQVKNVSTTTTKATQHQKPSSSLNNSRSQAQKNKNIRKFSSFASGEMQQQQQQSEIQDPNTMSSSSSTSQIDQNERFDVLQDIQKGNLEDAWNRLYSKVKQSLHPPFLVSKLLLKAFERGSPLAEKILEDMVSLEKEGHQTKIDSIFSELISESLKVNEVVIQNVLKARRKYLPATQLPLASETGQLTMRENEVDPRVMVYFVNETTTRRKENLLGVDPKLYQEQLKLETEATDMAVERYRKMRDALEKNLKKGASMAATEKFLLQWFNPLVDAIQDEQAYIAKKGSPTKQDPSELISPPTLREIDGQTEYQKKFHKQQPGMVVFGKHLLQLNAEKLAVVTLHTAVSLLLSSYEGVNSTKMVIAIGEAVQAEINLMALKKSKEKRSLFNYVMSGHPGFHKINMKLRYLNQPVWSATEKIHVGSVLLDILLRTAFMDISKQVPAFHYLRKSDGKKFYSLIKAGDQFYKTLDHIHGRIEMMHARMLPMVVPPKKWVAYDEGGYLASAHKVYVCNVMRAKDYYTQVDKTLKHSNLSQVFSGLNALNKTPWRINQEVYNVSLEAWTLGLEIGELPSKTDIPLPDLPDQKSVDYETYKKSYSNFKKTQQKNYDLNSLRCDLNLKLAVAEKFKDRTFYFPHNLDFRGRTYPIPPHLNHMGNDLCRGLLLFDTAMPLGEKGLFWLKIHTANVFGKDKLSFKDRVSFVDSEMDNILDSADQPLTGKRWWTKAESPWQTLAACFEIRNAVRSKDPTKYVTSLPVHQDGTCNGLQHYAALGGDELGAFQVNLLPSEKPQDVYTGVAILVAKRIAQDAANDHSIAKLLNGKIERKIVKQTVMTSVYGVTRYGAGEQIKNALKDRHSLEDDDLLGAASIYIAQLTFDALKEMFLGARQIMDWLTECAGTVASNGHCVSWTTPLQMKVVQPYRSSSHNQKVVKTVLQNVSLVPLHEMPVNVSRQKSAFPPNFVHSLDSTHLLLTATECEKQGIMFASVHDSYWTHPSQVDKMSAVLRDKFVELHSQPLLMKLRAELQQNYPGLEFRLPPKKGNLDLEGVKRSPYFFN